MCVQVCVSYGCLMGVGYQWHMRACVCGNMYMITEQMALPNTTIYIRSQSKQFLRNSEVTCTLHSKGWSQLT